MNRLLRFTAFGGLFLAALGGCRAAEQSSVDPGTVDAQGDAASPAAFWNNATIYFLLTDRFLDGDPGNDLALGRRQDGATLRSFMGGDLSGVLRELQAGYFDSLGVDALWMTPFVEQIHGSVDEGTGRTYGFHGYWTRDWTAVDPAFGTADELRAVVAEAHRRGIKVLMDAVLNHTGPVTPLDPQWPADWVRTAPRCSYRSYVTTVECTLVDNLPDVLTDRDEPVELPEALREKWAAEGRLEQETAELDAFFQRTGYPRAPRYYIVKWLTDWVREMGFDGYRVDTAKHFEEETSAELAREARQAYADWKAVHPDEIPGDLPFFLMGEVYNYTLAQGRNFDFGDRKVDYFDFGYDALINFGFKDDARRPLDELFTTYDSALRDGDLRGVAVVNYVSSHDDGGPYDRDRRDPYGAGTRLLLSPGGAQIYYGDEVARPLNVDGAEGDANLRSMMDWGVVAAQAGVDGSILEHWRKLGRFRRAHPAVGAGRHRRLQADPYVFSRTLEAGDGGDRVLVAMDQGTGPRTLQVFGVFPDGTELLDYYSGQTAVVTGGQVSLASGYDLVLLGKAK